MQNAYKILVRKPKGKRLLGRYRHRWEDNITLDLRRGRFGGCGLESSCSGSTNGGEFLD
jgi:hypothetical protein